MSLNGHSFARVHSFFHLGCENQKIWNTLLTLVTIWSGLTKGWPALYRLAGHRDKPKSAGKLCSFSNHGKKDPLKKQPSRTALFVSNSIFNQSIKILEWRDSRAKWIYCLPPQHSGTSALKPLLCPLHRSFPRSLFTPNLTSLRSPLLARVPKGFQMRSQDLRRRGGVAAATECRHTDCRRGFLELPWPPLSFWSQRTELWMALKNRPITTYSQRRIAPRRADLPMAKGGLDQGCQVGAQQITYLHIIKTNRFVWLRRRYVILGYLINLT